MSPLKPDNQAPHQAPSVPKIGELRGMPEAEVRRLIEGWWRGLPQGEREKLAGDVIRFLRGIVKWLTKEDWKNVAKNIAEVLLVLKGALEATRPGTPIGDLILVVSNETSEKNRHDAIKRFMKGRTPIAKPRYRAYKQLIDKELDESAPKGRSRDEEWRIRMMDAAFLAFESARNMPFGAAVTDPESVRGRIVKAMNRIMMEVFFGPLWRKDEEANKAPRKHNYPSLELGMELAGAPVVNLWSPGDEDAESIEVLSPLGRSTFTRSLEAHFARRFQEENDLRSLSKKAKLTKGESELLHAFMYDETTEEIAARTGKKIGAVYTQKTRLLKKISPFLKS